jgi:AcrR family transcriptional regulator
MAVRAVQRQVVTERLAGHLLASGLSRTSVRQLAAAAQVSDRMLLYYFRDKAEALGEAMGHVVAQLGGRLEAALPAGRRMPPERLLAEAARIATDPEVRPFMALWMEVIAAARAAARSGSSSAVGFDERVSIDGEEAACHLAINSNPAIAGQGSALPSSGCDGSRRQRLGQTG